MTRTIRCSVCDRHLTVDRFYPSSVKPTSKTAWCKSCTVIKRRESRRRCGSMRNDNGWIRTEHGERACGIKRALARPAVRLYMEAFEAFLRAPSPFTRALARRRMGEHLNLMMAEAGMTLADDTRLADDLARGKRATARAS